MKVEKDIEKNIEDIEKDIEKNRQIDRQQKKIQKKKVEKDMKVEKIGRKEKLEFLIHLTSDLSVNIAHSKFNRNEHY